MYTFTKEKINDEHTIVDGTYNGTLINIEDMISQKGDRMFKLTWKIGDTLINDYLIPEHQNDTCRKIAQQKLSCMAEFMLDAQDNEKVELMDCINKTVDLLIKLKEGTDGKMYPRIIAIKKPSNFKISKESSSNKESKASEMIDDDIHW